ncbi:MAG: D-alanyl-D-alanine carboxypeptidase family protein [Acidimicrobiales bacterium]
MTAYRSSLHAAHSSSGRFRSGRSLLAVVAVLVIVVLVALVVVQSVRTAPGPTLRVGTEATSFPGTASPLPWPTQGVATVDVQGIGTVGSKAAAGSTVGQQFPIASVTKIMASYIILKDHPLALSATGPSITVTPAEVTQYQQDLAQGDSVVAVTAGEQITELQALEGALLPSGDNIVSLLAQWDAGSVAAFVTKMNAEAAALGLTHTHYADASGVDPATVSTVGDQVRLAMDAMKNPVFAGIVAMPQVTLPGVGVQYNVNADVGKNGIVGVKTGWIPQGGASFVFAATHRVSGHTQTVIGAVMGQTGTSPLTTALAAGQSLATAVGSQLRHAQVMAAGARVATLSAPYSSSVAVVTTAAATLLGWPGAPLTQKLVLTRKLQAPMAKGTLLGYLDVGIDQEQERVPVVTAGALSGPSYTWRLTRF